VSTRLDHLVVGVADLSLGSSELGGAGLTFAPGGQHPGGTSNALLVSPERWAYVELITAPDEDEPGETSLVVAQVRRGGLVTWALAVQDLDTQVRRLVEAGFDCQPAEAGSRETTDGRTVQWRSAMILPAFGRSELPFLIEWTAGDSHRTGLAPDAGAAYVTEIEVGTRHLERMRALLELLGLSTRLDGGCLECFDGEVRMRFAEGEPRLSSVSLTRPDGARVRITDQEQARLIHARVDAPEGVA
jgi:hypothetical protein